MKTAVCLVMIPLCLFMAWDNKRWARSLVEQKRAPRFMEWPLRVFCVAVNLLGVVAFVVLLTQ